MEINYNQFLQFFTANRPPKATDKLLSLPLHKCPALAETAEALPEDLQTIFHTLFPQEGGEGAEVSLRRLLPLKERRTAMPVCNKLLLPNEQGRV
jgi:hypothetical protein